MEIANTTITIMRGTVVDEYGDESDVGVPYLTRVPAALTEVAKQVMDAATQRPQTVRSWRCVLPGWIDVLDSDTIMNERTRDFFMIEDNQRQPVGATGINPAIILTLRSRSGVAIPSDRRDPGGQ